MTERRLGASAYLRNEDATAATIEAACGWIEWAGGKCPVSADTLVEVKLRDGTIYDDTGDELAWSHDRHRHHGETDIIAYREVAA